MAPADDGPETIRSISRALRVLRAMNRRESWLLQELQQAVDLPKTTLFRILQTLQHEGYVRAEDTGRYRLTARLGELAGGYTERHRVVDCAAPITLQVTKRIKWPLAVATLDGDALVVRHSTMPYSPLAVHATTLGQRLGLLETAMGRVYLAFCTPAEREALLAHLFSGLAGDASLPGRLLARDLDAVRHAGHAVRLPNGERSSATAAVPILHGEALLAVIGLTTFGRLMTPPRVQELVPILAQTARDIATAYDRAATPPH